jgi:hypothetical protein
MSEEQINLLWGAIGDLVYWSCAEAVADIQQKDQGESRRRDKANSDLREIMQEVLGETP